VTYLDFDTSSFDSCCLVFSGERWTGFGRMPSLADDAWASIVLTGWAAVLAHTLTVEDGIPPNAEVQRRSSERQAARIDGRTSR
jgi:hypothetical protein